MAEKVDDRLARLMAEYDRKQTFLKLPDELAYVMELIRLLAPKPNGLARQMALHELRKVREKGGAPIPSSFEQAVQSSYNQYSVDSTVYQKRGAPPKEGLFYAPGGKGSGRWATNTKTALAWFKARLGETDS